LAFESLDGELLFHATGAEFFIQSGIEGLEIPPREIVTQTHPGMPGARLKEIRTNVREIFLPLFFEDISHPSYLAKSDQIANLFSYHRSDYAANDGTFNVVAYSARGERRLRCVYQGGMDTGYGTDSQGATWASFGLKFLCVQPYWYGDIWQTATIPISGNDPDFFAEFPGELSSSIVLGAGIPIEIGGDVPTWPVIEVQGPAASVTISGSNLLVSIPAGVGVGEKARIVPDPRGRTAIFTTNEGVYADTYTDIYPGGGDEVEQWSRIGPLMAWAPLAPGSQTLNIVITGAGSTTSATVFGREMWERPW